MNNKIQISQEIIDKCQKFSEASVDSSLDKYATRQQYSKNKIQDDIKIGKIGEEIAYQILKDKFPNLTQPCHKIFLKFEKSWDSDMKANEIVFSCKSQSISSEISFGASWIFQRGDGFKDCDKEVFDKPNDNAYAVFMSVNLPKKIAEMRAVVKIQWLHQNNLFKPMQKENLRSNKVAVYLDDLLQFKDNLWQL